MLAADAAEIRAGMVEADRTYAMGLAALRQAAELTQVEPARRLGVTQAAISRIEQPHDLLLWGPPSSVPFSASMPQTSSTRL